MMAKVMDWDGEKWWGCLETAESQMAKRGSWRSQSELEHCCCWRKSWRSEVVDGRGMGLADVIV